MLLTWSKKLANFFDRGFTVGSSCVLISMSVLESSSFSRFFDSWMNAASRSDVRSENHRSVHSTSLICSYHWRWSSSFPYLNHCCCCSRNSVVHSDGKYRVDNWARSQDHTERAASKEHSAALVVPEQMLFNGRFESNIDSLTSINGISRTWRIIWWISCKLCWTNKGTGLQHARTPCGSLERYKKKVNESCWGDRERTWATFPRFVRAYGWARRIWKEEWLDEKS